MPYIRRYDPQESFNKRFFNVVQWGVVIIVTLAFAYFLWHSRR
jgi:hypothetical protein